jgi:hypothetical protein
VSRSYLETLQEMRKKLEALRKGDAFKITKSFGFTKVSDTDERWEVEGIAASETLDQQNEVIEYPALKKAFGSFLGNVREMHSNVAVGKTIETVPDDARKAIIVKAMISKGAPDTWQKIKDGVLRGFSIGGQRLRSQILDSGIRKTTELKLMELSLVDAPANPMAFFSLVKVSGGVPVASALLAREGERKQMSCAIAIERVSRTLAAGCRPLQEELGAALKEVAGLAGTPAIRVDSTSIRDYAVLGPTVAAQLQILAKGLQVSDADTDRKKIAGACELLLLEFVNSGRRESGKTINASKLYREAASTLSKLEAPSSLSNSNRVASEGYNALVDGVFKLANMKRTEIPEERQPLTLSESREMEDKLAKQLASWNEAKIPQSGETGPAYERLSRTYFKISAMRKRLEGRALRLGAR